MSLEPDFTELKILEDLEAAKGGNATQRQMKYFLKVQEGVRWKRIVEVRPGNCSQER